MVKGSLVGFEVIELPQETIDWVFKAHKLLLSKLLQLPGHLSYYILHIQKQHITTKTFFSCPRSPFFQKQRNEKPFRPAEVMQSFMRDMSWTESVKLSIKLCDLRWCEEAEVAGQKMMAVSKSYIAFSHFCCKAALEHTLTLTSFERINFKQ